MFVHFACIIDADQDWTKAQSELASVFYKKRKRGLLATPSMARGLLATPGHRRGGQQTPPRLLLQNRCN